VSFKINPRRPEPSSLSISDLKIENALVIPGLLFFRFGK
jgi:hypothetical protein